MGLFIGSQPVAAVYLGDVEITSAFIGNAAAFDVVAALSEIAIGEPEFNSVTGEIEVSVTGEGTIYAISTETDVSYANAAAVIATFNDAANTRPKDSDIHSGSGTLNLALDFTGDPASATRYVHLAAIDDNNVAFDIVRKIEIETPAAAAVGFAVDEAASGGTFRTANGFRIWRGTPNDVLVVTGGGDIDGSSLIGGGGPGGHRTGGGGGSAERLLGGVATLTAQSYTVTGGLGGVASTTVSTYGTDGGAMSFVGGTADDFNGTALGGVAGGNLATATKNGQNGPSGSGASGASTALGGDGTPGQGSNGGGSTVGYGGAGGGGAGGDGSNAVDANGAAGGAGVLSGSPGSTEFICRGGPGGDVNGSSGSDGASPGSGAQGGAGTSGSRDGGSGGNGMVEIWYAIAS